MTRDLLLISVLLAALFVAPMPAGAQLGGGDGGPQDESLAPDAVNRVEVVTDPPSDTEVFFTGANPLPAGDFDAVADIVSLTVAETEDQFLFSLKHRGYPDVPSQASEVILGQQMNCDIDFRINGANGTMYRIGIFGDQWLDGAGYRFYGYFERGELEEDDNFADYDQVAWPDMALVAGDHVEILLQKEWFGPDYDGPGMRIGDRLSDFSVDCQKALAFVGYNDEAGGEAGSTPFRITAASRSGELSIGWPGEGEVSRLPVAADQPTKLSLIIKNLVERKLLVNVTAAVVDTEGKPLAGWKVSAAPTFEIAGESSLPVSIVVRPPADAKHRDGGLLRVQAFPLGFDDKVTLTTGLVAVVPPGPQHNTLYFHDAAWERCSICIGGPVDTPDLAEWGDFFVMNTLDTDPVYSDEPTEDEGVPLFSSDDTFVYLDAPLSDGLKFSPDGVIDLTMALRTATAREVSVRVTLGTNDEAIAYGATSFELGGSFEAFTMQLPVQPEMLSVPPGSDLYLNMRFNEEAVPDFFGGTWVDHIEWDLAASQMTLPLVAVPKAVVNITDGRTLPTLALGNQTESEEYVNPGETQGFDLFLINEGSASDVVGVKATVSKPGWKVSFYPGDQYSLEPGSAAPMCVSVAAPDAVKEGDIAVVNLTAWSRADAEVRTSLSLSLIVTNHEIDEEKCAERGEDEFVKPFTEREKRSPGPSLLLALAGLAGLVAMRRRR